MNPESGIHCQLELLREHNIEKVRIVPDFKRIINLVIQNREVEPSKTDEL